MSDNILNAAIIGTGFGSVVQYPAFKQHESFEPVALVGQHESKTKRISEKLGVKKYGTNWVEIINDPEIQVVSIATPPHLHKEMIIEALDLGKHVICEKPLSINLDDASEMTTKVEDSGLTGMVDLEFRYIPAKQYFVELIKSNYVGNVYQVNINVRNPTRLNPRQTGFNWWSESKKGGGILNALGSHYFDFLYLLFGKIGSVNGRLFTHIPKRLDKLTGKMQIVTADDAFQCLIEIDQNIMATMNISTINAFGRGSRVEVYGEDGALVLRENDTIYGGKIGDDQELNQLPIPEKFVLERVNGEHYLVPPFKSLLSDFYLGINKGSSPSPNFVDGLNVQRCIDALLTSNDKKRWIDID